MTGCRSNDLAHARYLRIAPSVVDNLITSRTDANSKRAARHVAMEDDEFGAVRSSERSDGGKVRRLNRRSFSVHLNIVIR
jgi:hypothetical protein